MFDIGYKTKALGLVAGAALMVMGAEGCAKTPTYSRDIASGNKIEFTGEYTGTVNGKPFAYSPSARNLGCGECTRDEKLSIAKEKGWYLENL